MVTSCKNLQKKNRKSHLCVLAAPGVVKIESASPILSAISSNSCKTLLPYCELCGAQENQCSCTFEISGVFYAYQEIELGWQIY